MVLFDNIQIGQHVEVLRSNGYVNLAKVRFKGSINGRRGDWVGLELASKVGNCDGMISGRRYFIVLDGYGLFTTADKIRFIPITRNSFDNYKSIRDKTISDDLFKTKSEKSTLFENDRKTVLSKDFVRRSYSMDKLISTPDICGSHRFPLYHHREKTKLKNEPENKSPKLRSYKIPLKRNSYFMHHEDFITPSTIPDYFVPKNKLRQLMRNSNLERIHTPKTHNHFEMRDFLHNDWWNDVSL